MNPQEKADAARAEEIADGRLPPAIWLQFDKWWPLDCLMPEMAQARFAVEHYEVPAACYASTNISTPSLKFPGVVYRQYFARVHLAEPDGKAK